jgi:hypothetical protein
MKEELGPCVCSVIIIIIITITTSTSFARSLKPLEFAYLSDSNFQSPFVLASIVLSNFLMVAVVPIQLNFIYQP